MQPMCNTNLNLQCKLAIEKGEKVVHGIVVCQLLVYERYRD